MVADLTGPDHSQVSSRLGPPDSVAVSPERVSDSDIPGVPSVEDEGPRDTPNDEKTDDNAPPSTTNAKPSPPGPPGPVDHGLLCWLQVVGSFALWTNSWGVINSFGVYQTYYEGDLLSRHTPSQISWVGSLQAFLLFFVGVLAGPLFDAGYFRHLCIFGNFMVVFGLMMTSICKEYWQVILAQGLTCGIGFGCLFLPGIAIVPQYFVKRRVFAAGLAAAGSGFGGVIYPIMFRRLQPVIGFGWTVRIIAFIALFFGVVAVGTLRDKMPAGKMRRLINPVVLRNIPLVLLSMGGLFILMGLYVPIIYVGTYSLQYHLTDENLAFYMVAVYQSASIVGRIAPTYVADIIGPVNMLLPASVACTVLAFAWIGIRSEAALIVFAVLYGAFFGVVLGIIPTCVVSLTTDLKTLGTSIGTVFAIASAGILVGSPISGAVLKGAGFVALQAFVGGILSLGALLIAASRVRKAGLQKVKL